MTDQEFINEFGMSREQAGNRTLSRKNYAQSVLDNIAIEQNLLVENATRKQRLDHLDRVSRIKRQLSIQ